MVKSYMHAWKSLGVKCFFHESLLKTKLVSLLVSVSSNANRKPLLKSLGVKVTFLRFVEESRCENWGVCFLT